MDFAPAIGLSPAPGCSTRNISREPDGGSHSRQLRPRCAGFRRISGPAFAVWRVVGRIVHGTTPRQVPLNGSFLLLKDSTTKFATLRICCKLKLKHSPQSNIRWEEHHTTAQHRPRRRKLARQRSSTATTPRRPLRASGRVPEQIVRPFWVTLGQSPFRAECLLVTLLAPEAAGLYRPHSRRPDGIGFRGVVTFLFPK